MWYVLVEIDNGSAPSETLDVAGPFDSYSLAAAAARSFCAAPYDYTIARVWVACEFSEVPPERDDGDGYHF